MSVGYSGKKSETFGCAIEKNEYQWLVDFLGYEYGFFGSKGWNEEDTRKIIYEWSTIFEVKSYITRVDFHAGGWIFGSGNISVSAENTIVCDMTLRSIKRPMSGLKPTIRDKKLNDRHEYLLRKNFPEYYA